MTNDELRADLFADPSTREIAEEQGMTLEAYVEATLKFVDDPDAGFAGGCDAPDCEHDEKVVPIDAMTFFEEGAPARGLPRVAPGAGVKSEARVIALRPAVIRG